MLAAVCSQQRNMAEVAKLRQYAAKGVAIAPAEQHGQLALVQSWAQCDRCNKWRRIPKVVADELNEDAPW